VRAYSGFESNRPGTSGAMTALLPEHPRQAYMTGALKRRRNKLASDPDVRCAILAAASKSLHDQERAA
jgi:hypothetical protein